MALPTFSMANNNVRVNSNSKYKNTSTIHSPFQKSSGFY